MAKVKNAKVSHAKKRKLETEQLSSDSESSPSTYSIASSSSDYDSDESVSKSKSRKKDTNSDDQILKELSQNRKIMYKILKSVEKIEKKLGKNVKEEKMPKDSKKIAEDEIVEAIKKKRENDGWRKTVRNFKVNDLTKERLSKLKDIYFGSIVKPRKLATEIGRLLWSRNFISRYLVGPKTTNRKKDRCNELPQYEEQRLRDCLKVFTRKFLDGNNWKWFVQDAINQATRDIRSPWDLDLPINETNFVMDENEDKSESEVQNQVSTSEERSREKERKEKEEEENMRKLQKEHKKRQKDEEEKKLQEEKRCEKEKQDEQEKQRQTESGTIMDENQRKAFERAEHTRKQKELLEEELRLKAQRELLAQKQRELGIPMTINLDQTQVKYVSKYHSSMKDQSLSDLPLSAATICINNMPDPESDDDFTAIKRTIT
ncbi:DNA ligase 1-like isoform X2 [Panonychus citri]|uniref:DNA ligase 1-like n=1 Tax=Panonychus citri TaxID=50023 RepID=UPI0023078CF8|nr:DNA ligase 1-like [Panonychus citri]XP_053204891.1 DNA ligase 1-like isoform X2 [Panonychus citri]